MDIFILIIISVAIAFVNPDGVIENNLFFVDTEDKEAIDEKPKQKHKSKESDISEDELDFHNYIKK